MKFKISQAKFSNYLWSNSNDLRNQLIQDRIERGKLKDHIRIMNKEIDSCKTGLEHDISTIINPRRINVNLPVHLNQYI